MELGYSSKVQLINIMQLYEIYTAFHPGYKNFLQDQVLGRYSQELQVYDKMLFKTSVRWVDTRRCGAGQVGAVYKNALVLSAFEHETNS